MAEAESLLDIVKSRTPMQAVCQDTLSLGTTVLMITSTVDCSAAVCLIAQLGM